MNMASPTASTPSPSGSIVHNLRKELGEHAPFSTMPAAHVDRFVAQSSLHYYAPGETLLSPQSGPVQHLFYIKQGSVTGRRGLAADAGGFAYEAGDLFPIGAALGGRAVTSTYTAETDVFCLLLPLQAMHSLAADSGAFADFLNSRVLQFLELSQRAVQASFASQTLAEQSLEKRLADLPRRTPASVGPDTPLLQALQMMHERRIGSVLVDDGRGGVQGILTRHDVLGRVTLPQLPLSTPVREVMSAPIRTLDTQDTAQDAALLMSRHGIRHVPVLEDGRVVNVVSERDLFALQRLSLKNVSTAIRAAPDLASLQEQALAIRRFARNLLGQGVHARQLTELISHLNDLLAERLVQIVAQRHGRDLQQACWVAFGSEGRGEQTIATDQDNGLIFVSDDPQRDRPAWLAFAREVNEGLDACGYPLCKGNVMASNPQCCLTVAEWQQRFEHWMAHGAPQDLLNASIYFDLRGVAGRLELVEPLRELITVRAAALPRLMKQLATNALSWRIPLNWRGAIDASTIDGRQVIDLKLQGTAIFVDAARIYALANGIPQTGTRARLEAFVQAAGVPQQEGAGWVTGFEFLQSLRLRVQIDAAPGTPAAAQPNLLDLDTLNDVDARVLREALRMARQLQQRLELDYQR